MPGKIVTPQEAAVLLSLSDDSSVFDLAGATHLLPGRVRDVLSRLETRNFVRRETAPEGWGLTEEGRRARNWLAHRFGSSSSTYIVLDDTDFPTAIDEGALDSALNQALNEKY